MGIITSEQIQRIIDTWRVGRLLKFSVSANINYLTTTQGEFLLYTHPEDIAYISREKDYESEIQHKLGIKLKRLLLKNSDGKLAKEISFSHNYDRYHSLYEILETKIIA